MKYRNISTASIMASAVAAGMLAMAAPAFANTEITATKTLNVCTIDATHDRYSGLITVTNTGFFPGIHLELNDCIGGTPGPSCVSTGGIPVLGSGTGPWVDPSGPCSTLPFGGFALVPPTDPNFNTTDCSIANPGAGLGAVPGTLVFSYTVDGAALTLPITNNAKPTIQNFDCQGPSCPNQGPTATVMASTAPPCTPTNFGCTLTLGFWKNHTTVWPSGFSPTQPWFSATMHIGTETWLSALTGGPTHKNGYWILARQYIAAVLNQAKNGSAPPDVVSTLALASAWFNMNVPSACDGPGSCSDQKGWAAILDTYNEGFLTGAPHCPE